MNLSETLVKMLKLLMFLMICVFAKAMENYEPAFKAQSAVGEPCSCTLNHERTILTKEAECGTPKEVYYPLSGYVPRGSHEEVYPEALWIKRCVGVCGSGYKCMPEKKHSRLMPIKIVNRVTSEEACALHAEFEHESCQCSAVD